MTRAALAAAAAAMVLILSGCGSDGAEKTGSARALQGQRLCGSTGILGELAPQIEGRAAGCGLQDGVRVMSVSGITLSTPAVVDCTTAKALKSWVDTGLRPAVGRRGGGVAELKVFASYTCRPRNGIAGAKVSEHGRGKAIDIGGFELRDGSEITVLEGWNARREGPMLKSLHEAACGIFGTVLGPKSDRFHANHFHLDTASYRSGPYCR
ncbi:extensin-like domain-containing protein [Mangrovicoccus algicola]|uniref:Extensin family protein n=1 Tax=Mangrovicoccus algicola TaxID=2771008 RepID=A0A8J7CFS1_9RHOB|nr:extensin family protein [Mangrovicoccus algicola]MBE3636585.1 extensin family protein [Mangrovicoccus algicola]